MVLMAPATQVEAQAAALRGLVAGLEPDAVGLPEAPGMWKAFDQIERLGAAAKLMLARRVHESPVWQQAGCRSAAEWMARCSGSSVRAARDVLRASKRLGALPAIDAALRAGELSVAQAELIADAATTDPSKEQHLLEQAGRLSLVELAEECGRIKAAADPDPEATFRRIHAKRRLRTGTNSEGAWWLSGQGTVVDGALFEHAIAPLIDELYDRARAEGRHDHRDTYAWDALQELLRRYLGIDDDLDEDEDLDSTDAEESEEKEESEDVYADDAGEDVAETADLDRDENVDLDVEVTGECKDEGSDIDAHEDDASDADDLDGGEKADGSDVEDQRANPPDGAAAPDDTDPDVVASGGNGGETGDADDRIETATDAPNKDDELTLPGLAPHTPAKPAASPGRTKTTKLKKRQKKRRKRSRDNPRYLGLLRIDLEALTRGQVHDGETVEISGLGPIPVSQARRLLGDTIWKLVITRGVDVLNVTHLGRSATVAQKIALLWTSPSCSNEACPHRFTQIDHRLPWADTHHTKADELDPLCPHDHWLKTHRGWSLVPGTGPRAFVEPSDPRHPKHADKQKEKHKAA